MMHSDDVRDLLGEFPGSAPLYTQSQAVFFPHAIVPLHFDQHADRQLLASAERSNRFLAIGWQPLWGIVPILGDTRELTSTVCLGRIVSIQECDQGRSYFLWQGICRVEPKSLTLFSEPTPLSLLDEVIPQTPTIDRARRRRELLDCFHQIYPDQNLARLMYPGHDEDLCLGELCDILASGLSLSPALALPLLAERNTDLRSDLLLDELRAILRDRQERLCTVECYPPFSEN